MDRAKTFKKIKELIDNPKATKRDLADVIEGDHVLAESLKNVIRDLGFPPKDCTVIAAIHLLGVDAIRNVVSERPSL